MAVADWLERAGDAAFCYLTTTGRRTGRQHTIEIWFASHQGRLYLLSGGGAAADWVRNVRADPRVAVNLAGETHAGRAHEVTDAAEDALARQLLVAKYQAADEPLEEWGRTALPVVVTFPGQP